MSRSISLAALVALLYISPGLPGQGSQDLGPGDPISVGELSNDPAAGTRSSLFVGDDLDLWPFWWEFNKAPFLAQVTQDREIANTVPRHQGRIVRERILPYRQQALRDEDSPLTLIASCAMALGKLTPYVDASIAETQILPLLRKTLSRPAPPPRHDERAIPRPHLPQRSLGRPARHRSRQ